jgi:hypothetical protein
MNTGTIHPIMTNHVIYHDYHSFYRDLNATNHDYRSSYRVHHASCQATIPHPTMTTKQPVVTIVHLTMHDHTSYLYHHMQPIMTTMHPTMTITHPVMVITHYTVTSIYHTV